MWYYMHTALTIAEYRSNFIVIKDTPYFTITRELLSLYCVCLGRIWLLYIVTELWQLPQLDAPFVLPVQELVVNESIYNYVVDVSMQKRCNSSASALELHLFYTDIFP